MIEATLPTMAQFATETVQFAAQAGPPADLPAQVPGFVSEILGAVGEAGSDAAGGLGDTISGLAPGGSDVAGEAAENAPGK
jgi:hypothetical protein